MADFKLPITASITDIAVAIRSVQHRSKKGLCHDPDALASLVHAQVARGQAMAQALGLDLADLHPSLTAWGDQREPYGSSDSTLVQVNQHGLKSYGTFDTQILVTRGTPWSGANNGELHLHLFADPQRQLLTDLEPGEPAPPMTGDGNA